MDEHFKKLISGTAAKSLQQTTNMYGIPEYTVLVEIHEDHIDLIEDILIENYKRKFGPFCLNTTQRTSLPKEDYDTLFKYIDSDLLKVSTAEHIRQILKVSEMLDDISKDVDAIKRDAELVINRCTRQVEEARAPTYKDEVVLELQEENDNLSSYIESLQKELSREKSKSWWTKLWE